MNSCPICFIPNNWQKPIIFTSDNSDTAAFDIDFEKGTLCVSSHYFDYLSDYPSNEKTNTGFSKLDVHPKDYPQLLKINESIMKRIPFIQRNLTLKTKSGKYIYTEIAIHFSYNNDGLITRTTGCIRDMDKIYEKLYANDDRLKKLNTVIESSQIIYWEYDIKKDTAYLSLKAQEYFNFPPYIEKLTEKIKSTSILSQQHKNDFLQSIKLLREGQKSSYVDVAIKNSDNGTMWRRISHFLISEIGDEKQKAISTSTDITRTMNAISEYEKLLAINSITSNECAISCTFNLSNNTIEKFTSRNNVFLSFKDLSASECLERIGNLTCEFEDSNLPSIRYITREYLISAYINGNDEFSVTTCCTISKNESRIFEVKIKIMRQPITNDILCFYLAIDKTDSENTKILFNTLSEITYEIIFEIDLNNGQYKIIKQNDDYKEEYPNEGNFNNVFKCYLDKNSDILEANGGVKTNFIDLEAIERNLSVFPFYILNYVKINDSGKILTKSAKMFYINKPLKKICFAVSDVTDAFDKQKETNTFMKQMLSMAKKTSEDRNTFLTDLSFNMRTPMNSISAIAKLQEDNFGFIPEIKESFGIIRNQIEQLINLVDDILDINAMQLGKFTFSVKPFSINEIVYEAKRYIFDNYPDRISNFKINKRNINHLNILGDKKQILKVILNLLANAERQTNENERILMTIKELPSSVSQIAYFSICVYNDGVKIDEKKINELLKPFYKENIDLTKENKVVNLNTVNSIVRAMGGSLNIDSRHYKGSYFEVFLPLQINFDKMTICELPENYQNIKYDFSSLNILLAEDNHINRIVTTRLLENFGAHVTTAKNGEELLSIFISSPENSFDVIFMDLEMPIINGYTATRMIRAAESSSKKNIPIIALSANAFATDIENCFVNGMNKHIAKPINIDTVYEALKELKLL